MRAAILNGIEGHPLTITAMVGGTHHRWTLPLTEVAARESRVRIQAALSTVLRGPVPEMVTVEAVDQHGRSMPVKHDTAGLDLPMALAICSGEDSDCGIGAIGELGLDGSVRPVRGVLPMVEALAQAGVRTVMVAHENRAEASLCRTIKVLSVRTLGSALGVLAWPEPPGPAAEPVDGSRMTHDSARLPSMDDVKGNLEAKLQLAVASQNRTPVLLVGPVGAGKTMLARRAAGLLPAMTDEEQMEVTRIHSVAGLNIGCHLVVNRPFRAPHHSTSMAGLVGGGAPRRPGEASLAHHGVLFLDQVMEFHRAALEALGQVLQAGESVLTSAKGTIRYPAKPWLICSSESCYCGRGAEQCRCTALDFAGHMQRIDRLRDMLGIKTTIEVKQVDLSKF